ncbi:hypothetical protein BLA29_007447 [Euroglyphus maynei]|uniref:Uncharacterized protein n=1 Tax=Euroglyphus maynei TaxID=6958 RepID=A0A1Y3ANT7_EURMA|nr:hypothetical protein BLA29_007447 [Euroglyphus maynei]
MLMIMNESLDSNLHHQQQQPQQQGMARKLSNSTIKRRLSGCLRKQDSHEYPILDVDNVIDDDGNTTPPKQERKTSWYRQRKTSWYRRASKIISRQRSVSEDHGKKKLSSTTNFDMEVPNIVVAPGKCRYSFSIGDNHESSDSTIYPSTQQEPQLPRNRNLEISSLLANASKRFLTASFNDLMMVPFHHHSSPSSSSSLMATNSKQTKSSLLNKPPGNKSRSKSSSYTDASIINEYQQNNRLSSKPINIVHSDSNLILINNQNNRQPLQRTNSSGYDGSNNKQSGAVDALVDRILREEGLGKYIDSGVIRAAQKELAEVCDLTPEGKFLIYFFSV